MNATTCSATSGAGRRCSTSPASDCRSGSGCGAGQPPIEPRTASRPEALQRPEAREQPGARGRGSPRNQWSGSPSSAQRSADQEASAPGRASRRSTRPAVEAGRAEAVDGLQHRIGALDVPERVGRTLPTPPAAWTVSIDSAMVGLARGRKAGRPSIRYASREGRALSRAPQTPTARRSAVATATASARLRTADRLTLLSSAREIGLVDLAVEPAQGVGHRVGALPAVLAPAVKRGAQGRNRGGRSGTPARAGPARSPSTEEISTAGHRPQSGAGPPLRSASCTPSTVS